MKSILKYEVGIGRDDHFQPVGFMTRSSPKDGSLVSASYAFQTRSTFYPYLYGLGDQEYLFIGCVI